MKRYRPIITLLVLLLTLGIFILYLAKNPSVLNQLTTIDPRYGVAILLLYGLFTFSLSLAVRASVKLCGAVLPHLESFKLTGSSSLANFFGPLQSGPGVRALYLKKKHDIPIKKYSLATLYYYGFYALISGFFLLSGDAQWRLPLILLLPIGAGVAYWVIRRRQNQIDKNDGYLNFALLLELGLATLVQLICSVFIYWIELTAIGTEVSFSQALSYSGAANFALFVSLTPGAIGFREAFLVFSQNLHHIDSSSIVAANILDRSLYLLFLGILFVWLTVTHTKKQLAAKSSSSSS